MADVNKGKGSEYRLVKVLIFWYGVALVLCLMSDSTRSAGVLGVSTFFHIEGEGPIGDAPVDPMRTKCKHIFVAFQVLGN